MSNSVNVKPYEWKDEFAVDIKIIDDEHKRFLEVVNKLIYAINDNKVMDELPSIFFALTNFAENHIANEEICLSEYKYPDFQRHKAFHNEFIERVIKMQNDFKTEREGFDIEMLIFLRNWFHNHIMKYDKEIVEFLKEKGVK